METRRGGRSPNSRWIWTSARDLWDLGGIIERRRGMGTDRKRIVDTEVLVRRFQAGFYWAALARSPASSAPLVFRYIGRPSLLAASLQSCASQPDRDQPPPPRYEPRYSMIEIKSESQVALVDLYNNVGPVQFDTFE